MQVQLILLLTLLLCGHSKSTLEIVSVSSSPQVVQNPVRSSHQGNRRVYITSLGHSLNPSDISVKAGAYPCEIINGGVTATSITCTTTKAPKTISGQYQYITLTSGKSTATIAYPHVVVYNSGDTPTIDQCSTSSSVAGEVVACEGVHEVNTVGGDELEIGEIQVNVGKSKGNRFGVDQEKISGNSASEDIKFKLEDDQEAGVYNISTTGQNGDSQQKSTMTKATLKESDNFQYTAVPAITNVTKQGNSAGQEVEIQGKGFSSKVENNTVEVDGNACKVTEASNKKIKCTLQAKNQSVSQKLETNDTQQNSGFVSGTGLFYKRYQNYGSDIFSFVSQVRAGGGGAVQADTIATQLKSFDVPYYRGQVWKGYFRAPTSGNYTFRGWAVPFFAFYISPTYGSVDPPSTPLIYSTTPQLQWSNLFYDNIPTASKTIELTANRSYYIEAYHLTSSYSYNRFKIIAEVPNNNTKLDYKSYQVDQIDTGADHQSEVMVYVMAGGTGGLIDLKIVRSNTDGKIVYNVNRTVSYGCSASEFNSALSYFNSFYPYKHSTQRFTFDSSNNPTTDPSLIAKYEYHVSLYLNRSLEYQNQRFTVTSFGYDGTFDQFQQTAHSPLIDGYAKITVGGIELNGGKIWYNTSQYTLENQLRKINGLGNVEVAQRSEDGYAYGSTWIISYKGYNGQIPPLVIDDSQLTGGKTKASATFKTLRNYSTDITFDPIDYRFLNTPSKNTSVNVKVNDIPAVCLTNCTYEFKKILNITSISLTGSVLTVRVSNPTGITVTAADIAIKAAGLPCTTGAVSGTTTVDVQCQLPTNTDGTPALPAGSITPQVFITGLGYVGLDTSTATPLTVPFVVTSIQSTSGSQSGGYLNTIIGTGFVGVGNPATDVTLTNPNQKITVQICSQQAIVKTTANQKVVFYVPPCPNPGTYPVIVKDGTHSDTSLSFTYTAPPVSAPQIAAVHPTSSNPKLKSVLNIVGANFGTDLTKIKVFLNNNQGQQKYELRVLTVNDTNIQCGLPGGLPGNYTVQVNYPNDGGDAVLAATGVNAFSYDFKVTAVSPASGSFYGGTLLTITGQNFLTGTGDTLVYIGEAVNWICTIQTITGSQITCLTPPVNPSYSTALPQRVTVSSKLNVFNSCPSSNCIFTYNPEPQAANLTSLSHAGIYGGQLLTLSGQNFALGGLCQVSFRSTFNNKITTITASTCNNTQAKVTVPDSLVHGNYLVSVKSSYGDSNPQELVVKWNLGSWSVASGSVEGGYNVLKGGSGFPDGFGSSYQLSMGRSDGGLTPVEVVSCCGGNEMYVKYPSAVSGTNFTFKFTSPLGEYSSFFLASPGTTGVMTLTYPSNSPVTPQSYQSYISMLVLNRTSSFSSPITSITLQSTTNTTDLISASAWQNLDSTRVNLTFPARSGSYRILVNTTSGYYTLVQPLNVTLPTGTVSTNHVASFAGGLYKFTGNAISKSSYIVVNGLKGELVEVKNSQEYYYRIPQLVTSAVSSTFSFSNGQGIVKTDLYTVFSDMNQQILENNVIDNDFKTDYQSTNAQCWVGADMGQQRQVDVRMFKYRTNLDIKNNAQIFQGAWFEGSYDMNTWTVLAVLDQTTSKGQNSIQTTLRQGFRYVRFRHNSTSQCNLAEMSLFGSVGTSAAVNLTSTVSTVTYVDPFNTVTLTGTVQYRQDKTAVVQYVQPAYGDIFGGYNLTLHGTNLNFSSTITVIIDGIPCPVVDHSSSTQLICTVGAKPASSKANSFSVQIGGMLPFVKQRFTYVLKWSDVRTWGTDLPPVDGDLIYVPQGQVLLIDVDTPQVVGIAAQNATVIVANHSSIAVKTGFITLIGGQFIAGTETHPLDTNLSLQFYGDYYSSQLPQAGNKGIYCFECKFSLYGQPRVKTWTTIENTIEPGDNNFSVSEDVDWQVGEEIVVASTSFNHEEAEKMKIVSIVGRAVVVDKKFVYKHLSVVEDYGGQKFVMKAQVGLLTRNIKIRGDPSSTVGQYGAHVKLSGTGSNFRGVVAYTEFTLCGQPQIPGRYCLYYHLNGQVSSSLARGNSFHQSYARAVALHGVHFLTVQNNVAYHVRGHNYLLYDGVQTKNVIRNNLAVSSLKSSKMWQTDITVASFMISNPTNDVYGNRAAGSDFYGFWFGFRQKPEGVAVSALGDVCPQGNPVGNMSGNYAHSNTQYGMRLFTLYARKFPCLAVRNDQLTDPWSQNPSVESLFDSFVLYKNKGTGLLAEYTGHLVFDNFKVVQNGQAGIELYEANFTKQNNVIRNSLIVGRSNSSSTSGTFSAYGLVTPRTGSTNLTNVSFHNFPTGGSALTICSQCDRSSKLTNLGTQIFTSVLSFSGMVGGNYIKLLGVTNSIIYDQDGSLAQLHSSKIFPSSTLIFNYNHILQPNPTHCFPSSSPSLWNNLILCDSTLSLRRVWFTNMIYKSNSNGYLYTYYYQTMYTAALGSITAARSSAATTTVGFTDPLVEKSYSWSLPFVVGGIYEVWWGVSSSEDFEHMSVVTTDNYPQNQKGIVFKFAYTQNRQFYQVGRWQSGASLSTIPKLDPSIGHLDPATCTNGAYFHNNTNVTADRMLTLCQSGKNRTRFQYTEVNAVFCKYLCPKPAPTYNSSCNATTKQTFIRLWSNASQWPNQTVPAEGENVTIQCDWTMRININPKRIGRLIVDGDLVVDDSIDVNLTANSIWIRAGSLTVGNSTNPFTHKFDIQINGNSLSPADSIDPLVTANKYLVVTGSLALYGAKPSSTVTYLKQTANKGQNVIWVGASTGWKVGDSLSLSPSYSASDQYEEVTIQSINADGSITLATALTHGHYGSASSTITHSSGTLDARTRVGHLTRNIRIVAGPALTYGFTTYVYRMFDDASNKVRIGNLVLNGVEMRNGGQDSFNPQAALQFLNVIGGASTSTIVDSVIANCLAECIAVKNSHNISITNTILYRPKGIGLHLIGSNVKSLTFSRNLIVGVAPSDSAMTKMTACLVKTAYNDPADLNYIDNNVCQGSQGYGFVLPHLKCNELSTNTMKWNTAGSCRIGFLFSSIGQLCQGFSRISAYACAIGQVSNAPDLQTLVYKNFVLADNVRAGTLKFGGLKNSMNNTAYLNDSYITAVARLDCSQCYPATACSNSIALRMLSVSQNGVTISDRFVNQVDIITHPQALDAKVYLFNVIFNNYRQNYSSTPAKTTIIANCKNNFVFRPHPSAVDATGGHYLFDCSCLGCDTYSYAYCQPNSDAYLGAQGGCGDMQCTGKSNYLIQDWTGGFLGFKGTVIPNNEVMGNNQVGCSKVAVMNGHVCQRQDFAVLQFQSKARDYNKRIVWPVTLRESGNNYKTVINGWRQWQFSNGQPLGTRLGRFLSIIQLSKSYNMSFATMPPLDMTLQLQKRTPAGNNSNWVIIKLYYPLPNSIRIFVDGVRQSPIITTDITSINLRRELNTSICGDNIYFFSNRTINVVLTEALNCSVKISVADSIQLTTHFALNASDFFTDTVMSNFIDNLCALLGITDNSRVKIVGVHSGSTIVQTVIQAQNSTDSTPSSSPTLSAISSALTTSISSGTFSTTLGANISTVLGASSSLYIAPDTLAGSSASSGEEGGMNIMIIAAAAGGAGVVGLVILVYCLYKRGLKLEENVANQLDGSDQKEVNQKEQSHNIIVSDSMFFENIESPEITRPSPAPSPKKKVKNRRMRNRQVLEIKEYD